MIPDVGVKVHTGKSDATVIVEATFFKKAVAFCKINDDLIAMGGRDYLKVIRIGDIPSSAPEFEVTSRDKVVKLSRLMNGDIERACTEWYDFDVESNVIRLWSVKSRESKVLEYKGKLVGQAIERLNRFCLECLEGFEVTETVVDTY